MTDETLLTAARAALDKLRDDIAETERDIAYQQTRLDLMQDLRVMLLGGAAPDARPRTQRRPRLRSVPETPAPEPPQDAA